ncbi:MAG: FAD-linked oxidase C-terminal domain-containing protein [Ardenticatenales bacterium]
MDDPNGRPGAHPPHEPRRGDETRASSIAVAALADLADRLGPGAVSTASADIAAASHDAGLDRAYPLAVVRPTSTADVVAAVRWAREAGVSVVARGAGTGLSGGAVPGGASGATSGDASVAASGVGSIVLALDHLDAIAVHPLDRVAVCGPGAITAHVDEAAAAHGLMYPPDPASWRMSTVGGNAATNAGGPRCLKYGVTAAYVQGLTAVLADGSTLRLGGRALDPPGPDVIGLLVGSEGTLAIVTELMLRLLPRPTAGGTLLASFDDVVAAGAAVAAIVARGLVPAALELMDRAMLAIIAADRGSEVGGTGAGHLDDGPSGPIADDPQCASRAPAPDADAVLLVEVDGHPASIAPQLAAVAAAVREAGGRCRIAADDAERASLWAGRRSAGTAVLRPTGAYHTADVAVPPSRLPAMIDAVRAICAARGRAYGLVAHAGDGNLHPLIPFHPHDPADARAVAACVAEIAAAAVAAGGTVSGEHGVGSAKRAYLPWLYDRPTLDAMRAVKDALDPRGTLNPGKVLPAPDDPGAPWPRDGAPPSETPDVAATALTVAADDLVLTAPADATLADAHAAAHAAGRLLPLASPWPDATLREVIGQRLEAPWRTHYGGIGDALLTVTATLPNGRTIRTGRAVRKHVAGYAIGRLFVGAGGAMGRIDAVSLRLVPAPPCRTSLLVGAHDAQAALAAALAVRAAGLGLSAVLVIPSPVALAVRPDLGGATDGAVWSVIATLEGHAADVEADVDAVTAAMRAIRGALGGIHRVAHAPDDLGGVDVWAAAIAAAASTRASVIRHAMRPGAVSAATSAIGRAVVVVDVLGGQVYVRRDGVDAAREGASDAGADVDTGGWAVAVRDPRGQASWGGDGWGVGTGANVARIQAMAGAAWGTAWGGWS